MKVGYLMSHYPAISHAFVLREVRALRDAGVAVETLSIHRADPRDLLAELDRQEAQATFNVLPTSARRLCAAHLAAFARSPLAYLSTLVLALRTASPGLRERLWHLFYFGEAMITLGHCRRAGIAHIHAQFADSATDVAMLVSHYQRRTGTSMTWSLAVHGSIEFYNVIRHGLPTKLARATFAVAISDFGRSQLMYLTPEERWPHIHVVRCGVDPDEYVPPPSRAGSPSSVEILFVGRLLPAKGLSLLFTSIAELAREGFDISLTIVGDGPARRHFEQAAQAAGVFDRTRFLGAVGQDGIRERYAGADLFCLPSFAEGIPVVAMEAMAMGLPVISTRVMGIPELVDDGEHGRLIAPGRIDVLTDALRDLARSPESRQRMGAAARRKVVKDYDVRVSARRMRAVLEREVGLPPTVVTARDSTGEFR